MMRSRQDPRFTRWLPILLALVAMAATLRIVYASGFIPVDDAEYARVAARVLDGTFSREEHTGPPVNHSRAGMVLPVAALFAVFGPSEVTLAAYPFLLSLVTILVAFAFAARMFGVPAGLITVAIWALVPLDLDYAARLTPDTPVTAFAFSALFLIYSARNRPDASGAAWRGAAAGLAFGAAWLCKESTVYFGPFCLILLGRDLLTDWRRYAHLWGGVAAGALLVFGSELAFYALRTGDWLYRFHTIQVNYQLYPEFFFNEGAKFGYEAGMPLWKAIAKRVLLEGPQAFFLSREILYLPTFGLIAAAWAWYRRDERFFFMSLLFATLLLMFNFFSASLEGYQPLPLFFRYFHPLVLAAAILTGGLVGTLLAPLWSRTWRERPEPLFWGLAGALALGIVASWSTFRMMRDETSTWASAERELAATLRPADPIFTDALSRAGLEFFWKYPQTMNVTNLSDMTRDAEIPCDSRVLLNRSYRQWLLDNPGMWYTLTPYSEPEVVGNPPSDWEQAWTNGNATLYRVACRRS